MKKIGSMLILLLILLCPLTVKADGYVPETTPTPSPTASPTVPDPNNPSTQGYEKYSNDISKQDVKAGNQKQSSALPLVLTIITLGALGGGYYFYQTKKSS